MKAHIKEVNSHTTIHIVWRKKVSSLTTFIYVDPYEFLNGLTADRAFIGLKRQLFCTIAAHTLEKTNKMRIRNCSLKSEKQRNRGVYPSLQCCIQFLEL